jgi:hypothetical protein
MNKETQYLYVMGPSYVAGSVCITTIKMPDLGDEALSEYEVVRRARLVSTRTESNRRWSETARRLPQTLSRFAKRILQRRPVQAGVAA